MQPESNNNNNDSVKIDMEKQEHLPPVPEDAPTMQEEMKDMKMEEKMEESSVAVTMEEEKSVESK
jgi:hypothetical protein